MKALPRLLLPALLAAPPAWTADREPGGAGQPMAWSELHPDLKRRYPDPARLVLYRCGDLVSVEDAVLHNSFDAYYDNGTGRLVSDCSAVHCLSNGRSCAARCPPGRWACRPRGQ